MGKNKLARWAEIKTLGNVIEHDNFRAGVNHHPLRGKWRQEYFGNNNPVILELGCGKGEYTTGLAGRMPEKNFIGIDIKGARLWKGAKTAFERKLRNVLFIRTRIEFINSFFAEDEVDEIWLTFPDPHEKRRSKNRRLTSPPFLNRYRLLLKNNGLIHLKTDNIILYEYTLKLVTLNKLEIVAAFSDLYATSRSDEILSLKTYYEEGFLKEGKKIHYLSFRLNGNREITDYETEKRLSGYRFF